MNHAEEFGLKLAAQKEGRKSASNRMLHAIDTSTSPLEMSMRLRFLRAEAIHILATWVLNDITQANLTREKAWGLVNSDFDFEIDLLFENVDKTILYRPKETEEDEEDQA